MCLKYINIVISIENPERPCVPSDFLNATNYFDNILMNSIVGGENTVCLPTCVRTEYQLKISEGKIDPEAVKRFSKVSKDEKPGNPG